MHKAQEALKTCDEHEHKELSCFCKTCKKFICISCGKTTHHGHDWDLIATIAKERRMTIPNNCRKIKQEKLPKYRQKIRSLNNVERKCIKDIRKHEERRNSTIGIINRNIDEQRKQRDDLVRKQIEELKGLEPKLAYLEKMTTSLDINIASYSDYEVIEMEQQMLEVLGKVESHDAALTASGVALVPGEEDEELLDKMVGKIEDKRKRKREDRTNPEKHHSVRIEELKEFKQFDNTIRYIVPISDTQAWVGDYSYTDIKLLSCKNVKVKRMTLTSYWDFITLSNCDFVVTIYNTREIRRGTATGEESVLVCTNPLFPTWICRTQTDDILVTLRDGGDLFSLHTSRRRLVQRMTLTGKVLHTYEFREDGVTRLFTAPWRTTENGNSDICVINLTSKAMGELIVLHSDGRVRFAYHGPEVDEFEFCPLAVACDSKSRIIVSDGINQSLHLLSPDGTFLRYLMSNMFDYPWTMELYQDKLWVGFYKGAVKVYKYTT